VPPATGDGRCVDGMERGKAGRLLLRKRKVGAWACGPASRCWGSPLKGWLAWVGGCLRVVSACVGGEFLRLPAAAAPPLAEEWR